MNALFNDNTNNFLVYDKIESVCSWGDSSILSKVDLTIIMPIYNHPKYLRESLESAVNQLTNKDYAVLVVDNDTDSKYKNEETIKSVNDRRIVYYRNQKNIGLVGNWNRCITLAQSKYVTFLHDDDRMKPYAVDTLLKLATQYKGQAIIGNYDLIDGSSCYLEKHEEEKMIQITPFDLLSSNGCNNGVGGIFERDKILTLGGFSEAWMPCLDYAFFAKYTIKYGSIRYTKSVVDGRREENFTFDVFDKIAACDLRIKKCLADYVQLPNIIIIDYINLNYVNQQCMLYKTYGNKNYGRELTKFEELRLKFYKKIIWHLNNRYLKTHKMVY